MAVGAQHRGVVDVVLAAVDDGDDMGEFQRNVRLAAGLAPVTVFLEQQSARFGASYALVNLASGR